MCMSVFCASDLLVHNTFNVERITRTHKLQILDSEIYILISFVHTKYTHSLTYVEIRHGNRSRPLRLDKRYYGFSNKIINKEKRKEKKQKEKQDFTPSCPSNSIFTYTRTWLWSKIKTVSFFPSYLQREGLSTFSIILRASLKLFSLRFVKNLLIWTE